MPADIQHANRAPFDTANFILPPDWHALTDLLSGADTGVLMLQDGQILQLNTALAGRLGYEPEELAGEPLDIIRPPAGDTTDLAHRPDDATVLALQDKWGILHEFQVLDSRLDPLSEGRCTILVLRPAGDEEGMPASGPLLAITEKLPDLVLVCAPDAEIRYANKAFDVLTGRRRGALPTLVHPDDRDALQAALAQAAAAESAPLVLRVRRADGGWSHVAGTASNLLAHPDVQGLLLNVRDVTRDVADQQRGESERRRQLHYLNRLLRIAQRPQANLDTELKLLLKSAAKALALHRCAYWEVGEHAVPRCLQAYDDLRQNFTIDESDDKLRQVFLPLMHKVIDEGRPLAVADVDRDPLAALYCEYFHAHRIKSLIMQPVAHHGGAPGLLLLSCIDTPRQWRKDETEFAENVAGLVAAVFAEIGRSRSDSRLRDLKLRDELTGLPNRNFLLRQAADIFPRLSEKSDTMAAFFVDLDGFTEINDELGHALGDELLKATALRLKNAVRRDDVLVRLGGDEFLLLAHNLGDRQIADEIAQQIIDSMRGVFALQGRELRISASVGVAIYPSDGTSLETLMRKADSALFQAKASGRGQYRMYAPRISEAGMPDFRAQLRQALARGELRHYYQPQVDLRSGRVRTVEAVLRWQHPQHGLLLPASFLPLAEQNGMMPELSTWLLEDICMQIARWQAHGCDGFNVAVKLSASQLADPGLLEALEDALRRSGIDAQRLELEVKESDMARQDGAAARLLERSAGMRIGLSMDGVDGGNAERLRRYPVHKVKIEPGFASSEGGDDIADAVISVAHPMGMDVVAKGVETSQQVAYLREHGCDIAQGYYYTQPLTADQFQTWLTRH